MQGTRQGEGGGGYWLTGVVSITCLIMTTSSAEMLERPEGLGQASLGEACLTVAFVLKNLTF